MSKTSVDSIIKEATDLDADSTAKPKIKSRSYIDSETGFDTFYIKNKGNTKLRFSKINMSIDRGAVLDLLTFASIDDLNRSSELRNFLSQGKKLVRLTKEEYEHEMAVAEDAQKRKESAYYEQEKRIADIMTGSDKSVTRSIRPAVTRKVGMLLNFMGSDPARAKTGLDPISFCEWAGTEDFQENEIDYVISSVTDSEVRSVMYRRKKELFG